MSESLICRALEPSTLGLWWVEIYRALMVFGSERRLKVGAAGSFGNTIRPLSLTIAISLQRTFLSGPETSQPWGNTKRPYGAPRSRAYCGVGSNALDVDLTPTTTLHPVTLSPDLYLREQRYKSWPCDDPTPPKSERRNFELDSVLSLLVQTSLS